MPQIEVLPNSTSISAPGWAYVPDTGYDPSKAAIQPSGARKRAARNVVVGGGDTTARQNNAVLKHLAELDKDNHRDVQIPVPTRQRDTAGRVSKGKVTQAVRRILTSQKTFANHLADEEAALSAHQQPPSTALTPRPPPSKPTKTPTSRLKRSSTSASTPTPTPTDSTAQKTLLSSATLPGNMPPPSITTLSPDDTNPLLRSYIPSAPSEAILNALVAAPPLSYNLARARPSPPGRPQRQFCEICGYWGRIKSVLMDLRKEFVNVGFNLFSEEEIILIRHGQRWSRYGPVLDIIRTKIYCQKNGRRTSKVLIPNFHQASTRGLWLSSGNGPTVILSKITLKEATSSPYETRASRDQQLAEDDNLPAMTIQHLMESPDEEQPPDGCHHYNSLSEVPWDIQKYWYQRYSISSKYDQGIWMTDDAWFGVTPEPVANKIAQHMAHSLPSGKGILIDAFAGAGGNAIAFARSGRWNRVYAIEKDAKVLACAKHNAAVYGVQGKISWFQGDCFEIIQKELADVGEFAVIFASPPWGGPGYRSDTIFDLSVMQPYSLTDIYEPFSKLTGDIALYLPRTSDVRQLAQLIPDNEKMTVIHYCMEGASKALCAYIGGFQLDQV